MKKLIFLALCAFSMSAFAADYDNGKKIYNHWCLPCHGAGMPGTNALYYAYKGTDIAAELTKRTDLTPEAVEFFVRNGKHSMPFFRKTEINDTQMKDLGEYLSNAYKKESKK
ncbi:cytochrome c [Campylobacter sp. faydin G-105]|uniref:c-type cytochrome n=1 Tax=Campylobacter anatolicus TaxID=2829105 RepID=UPI001B9A1EB4|nr:cytochrome c [Campylobacter anatolicus]